MHHIQKGNIFWVIKILNAFLSIQNRKSSPWVEPLKQRRVNLRAILLEAWKVGSDNKWKEEWVRFPVFRLESEWDLITLNALNFGVSVNRERSNCTLLRKSCFVFLKHHFKGSAYTRVQQDFLHLQNVWRWERMKREGMCRLAV